MTNKYGNFDEVFVAIEFNLSRRQLPGMQSVELL